MDIEHEIENFDHHRLATCDDPYPLFAELRKRPPFFASGYDGYWVFTRYRDIFEIARDDSRFSSAGGVSIPPVPESIRTIPIEVDPPEFHEYRRFMHPSFTLARSRESNEVIRADARELMRGFTSGDEVEIIEALAMPMPAMAICRLVGIPTESWRAWWDLTSPHRPEMNQENRATEDMMVPIAEALGQVSGTIKARKSHPEDDFLSRLANDRLPSGAPIEHGNALKISLLLFLGGFGTTTAAIGSTLHYLGLNPEVQQRLRDHPELIPTAIDEFLRYFTPVIGLARTVVRDTEVGGVKMSEGDRLYLLWASGNRDDFVFEAPDELRIDRHPNRHMTFGVGAHRCIGQHVARVQMQVALELMLEQYPGFEVVQAIRPSVSPSGVRGFESLRLRLH